MKIKITKQRVNNQSTLKHQSINPEQKIHADTNKGIVFQSQFDSIRNYFSLLHHIFGHDNKSKQILKMMPAQPWENKKNLDIQITDINSHDLSDNFETTISKSPASKIEMSPKHSLQNHYSNHHRLKWRESILRRKNNGSHGEILKGNPKNNHSRLMSKAIKTEEAPKEPQKDTEIMGKEDFIPLGSMHSASNNIFPFRSIDIKSDLASKGSKGKFKYSMKPKSNRKYLLAKQEKKSIKTLPKEMNENEIMSRTCFPLKSSLQISDSFTVRKTIISTPFRYKSRRSTPCPWEYTSQR